MHRLCLRDASATCGTDCVGLDAACGFCAGVGTSNRRSGAEGGHPRHIASGAEGCRRRQHWLPHDKRYRAAVRTAGAGEASRCAPNKA
eukprot:scaffold285963_cov19-Tisochrysis_lutea.AAC.1